MSNRMPTARFALLIFSLLALFIAAACSGSGHTTPAIDGDNTPQSCIQDAECQAGWVCDNSLQTPGVCVAKPSCSLDMVGAECATDAQCTSSSTAQYCREGDCVCVDVPELDGDAADGDTADGDLPTDGDAPDGPIDACSKTSPLLTIEPVSSKAAPLDFGMVQVGQHVSRTIVLRNDGSKNLTIFVIDWGEDSAPDYKSDTDSVTIPTPENQTITIKPGESFPLNIGVYVAGSGVRQASVMISSDSCVKPKQFAYFSTSIFGSTTIDVAPTTIDFGAIEVGKTETRAFYIKNVVPNTCDPTLDPPPSKPCNKAIGVSNFKIEGPDANQFSITSVVPVLDSDTPHYITPGQTYEVKVSFHPNIANNETNPIFDAYVRFYHDADINPYGSRYEQIKVNLTGTGVVPKLCIQPDSIAFNQIPIGTASTQSVKLTDCGGAPLIITAIDWDANYTKPAGCDISLQGSVGAMLDATQFTFFMVSCTPPTLNPQSGFITVTWNGDQRVSIPITYTVVADQILVEPSSSLDFGPVKIGNTQTGTVRITNQGGSSVTILGATAITNNSNEFALTEDSKAKLPKVLNTNQSVLLDLIYSPKVQQTVQTSGTLSILTSSPSMPKKDLSLLGTPLWPICDFRLVEDDLLVSPNGTIAFGDVPILSRKTLTLRVDNTSGTYDCEVPVFRKGLNTADQYSFNPPIIPAVAGGTYYDIQVTCAPDEPGTLPGNLVVSTNDLRSDIANFSLKMTCTGVNPSLVVSPDDNPTDLGSVLSKGCTNPGKHFTIKNNGNGILKVCRLKNINDNWGQWSGSCYLKMSEWNTWQYGPNGSGTQEEGDYICWYLRRYGSGATDMTEFYVQLCGCNEYFPPKNAVTKEISGIFNLWTNDPSYPPASNGANKKLYMRGEVRPCPSGYYDLNGNPDDGCEYKCDTENIGYEICDGKDNDCDGLTDETFDVPLSCKQIDGTYKPNCVEVAPIKCHGTGECGWGHKACVPGAGNEFKTACDTDPGMPNFNSALNGKELCDGLDNDCDGKTDNFDFPILGQPGVTCDPSAKGGQGEICAGVGECKTGHCKCNASSVDPSHLYARCDAQDQAATRDWCDYKDNDCDGLTDNAAYFLRNNSSVTVGCEECHGDPSCHCTTSGVGVTCTSACGIGTYVCDSPKIDTVVCSGDLANASNTEFCDGIDNNCMNGVDEGEYIWDNGAIEGIPPALRAQCLDPSRSCGFVGVACNGRGECGQGFTQCSPNNKSATICSTDIGGAEYNKANGGKPEICDGKDNDCDGVIDNGFDVNIGCVGKGECGKHSGVYVCDPNDPKKMSIICSTNPGSGSPDDIWATTEKCNGLDDNCDGQTDEGFGVNNPCMGRGICGVGKLKCLANGSGTCCSANPECGGTNWDTERCNGLDDDCDGQTDEGFHIGEQCRAPGACGGTDANPIYGQYVCTADQQSSECSTLSLRAIELCDGIDNDCDGVIDNGYDVGQPCRAVGECGGTDLNPIYGHRECNPVTKRDTRCSTAPGGSEYDTTRVELCNYKDDDCDGVTDNGWTGPGGGTQTDPNNCGTCGKSCYAGAHIISATCEAGKCKVTSCAGNWYDTDTIPDNGCECQKLTTSHPGATCVTATSASTTPLSDNAGSNVTVTGILVNDNDADWYTFTAVDDRDDSDANPIGADNFHVTVKLKTNPASGTGSGPAQYVVRVLRGRGDQTANAICGGDVAECNSVDYSLFDYRCDGSWLYGSSKPWGDGNKPCQGSNQTGSDANSPANTSVAAYNTCNNGKVQKYFVEVRRAPGAGATCTPYELELSNGVYHAK